MYQTMSVPMEIFLAKHNHTNEGAQNGIVSRESPTTYKNGRKPLLACYELTQIIPNEHQE